MTVARTRSLLYSLARFLGDYQAIKNGRVAKRLARQAAGRVTGRGRLFRQPLGPHAREGGGPRS